MTDLPPGGAAPASTGLEIIRPADLLWLTFDLVNLTVQGGQLVRSTAGAPASITITLPPQHLAGTAVPAGSPLGPPQVVSSSSWMLVFGAAGYARGRLAGR